MRNSFRLNCNQIPRSTTKIVVGLSGGADSVTLLDLLVKNKSSLPNNSLIEAVYVHHGLNPHASDWSNFCSSFCEELKVPFYEERVHLPSNTRNVEAEAREKRYEALAKHLDQSSILTTAHHQNDLAETFFLALKRGAGLPGLSTMGVLQPFVKGFIWRPLLDFSRAQIEQYVAENHLAYVTDDSNFDLHYDRNFFRHEVISTITERFPEFLSMVKRSSSYIYEAQILIDELAEEDLRSLVDQNHSLDLVKYSTLSIERQHNALRKFIHKEIKKYPSVQLIAQFEHDLLNAKEDANPILFFENFQLRKFKQRLYVVDPKILEPTGSIFLEPNQTIKILDHTYQLVLSKEGGLKLKDDEKLLLSYDYSFSLKIHPYNRVHSRELKKLFMEYEIPTWQRKLTPLLKINDQVVGLFPNYFEKDFYTKDQGYIFKRLD